MIKEAQTNLKLLSSEDLVKKPKEKLKQRAYLNTITSMIDYGVLQIVGFIVSPFIVKGLGGTMYGIWKMLSQMTGYATLADSRATQVLKWSIAKKKDVVDEEELRSDVSSAFFVSIFILPLVLIIGGVISWYSPFITNADPAYYNLIRITCSLLILSLTISKFFDLFESVLRGMNLGYKRMGLRATIVLFGGGLKIFAITNGYGLIGITMVQVLITIVTGFSFYFIVKKHVGWFGFGKTNLRQVLAFGKLSGWNMANTTTDTLLTSTDKVLLGYLANPFLVSSYALTGFLPLAIQGLIVRIIIGVMPGMGKLIGLQEYAKISRVRETINTLIFLLTTASGVTIILFNHSFIRAWVGDDYFAGNLVNSLIVIGVLQDTFIKHDGYVITATLDLKKKVYLTCISAIVFISMAFLLIKIIGIVGLCISIILSKFLLFLGQRVFIDKKLKEGMSVSFKQIHPLITSIAMLVLASWFSSYIQPFSLLKLICIAPITFVVSFLLFYSIGVRKEMQMEIKQTLSSIRFFKSN